MNYTDVIYKLNEVLEGTYDEKATFFYSTSNFADAISLLYDGSEIGLWDSEDDECSYDYGKDGDYSEEFLVNWVLDKVNDIGINLSGICLLNRMNNKAIDKIVKRLREIEVEQ